MEAKTSLPKLLGHELLARSLPSNAGANNSNLSIDKISNKIWIQTSGQLRTNSGQIRANFRSPSNELRANFVHTSITSGKLRTKYGQSLRSKMFVWKHKFVATISRKSDLELCTWNQCLRSPPIHRDVACSSVPAALFSTHQQGEQTSIPT